MATSGSVNFTVTRNEILEGALRMLASLKQGMTMSSADVDAGAFHLNLIVKQWMGNSDFAPGLKAWTRKRGTIFPELNEAEYTLGPNGDHATSSYSSTTISADEAIGQTTLSVTSTTGMTASDNIGIRCNDGSIHWSTISSTGAGTVTIASALTVAANSGSTVYWYTTKLLKPLHIISLRRKATTGSETAIDPMQLHEYEAIGDKTVNGTPTRYLYEEGLTDGSLFFDQGITDTTEVLPITFLRTVEDFDAAGDNPDFPQMWYRPLVIQLAIDQAPSKGKSDMIQALNSLLHGNDKIPGALTIARHAHAEQAPEDLHFMAET